MDILSPWHDFFLTTGGGAAVLAGLVFVAMSINVAAILQDATHRSRAVGNLAGFAAVFMMCIAALMPAQSSLALGIEWLLISVAASAIFSGGYFRMKKVGERPDPLSSYRLIGGGLCYLGQIAGSILLILNNTISIYIIAISTIVLFTFMISGAWLLVIGAHEETPRGSGT